MAKAYWIARVEVEDAETYKDYVSTAAPAFARFGAKFLARGGAVTELEGEALGRNVVIEFESAAAAKACYDSPEYQAAKAIRQRCARADMIVVEGVPS
ncbi:DUF1330 domain-containing protein [Aurantimonas sp. Leaf443]|uniref:DUF1330 domain-containing protein n=1 Tax=Aurantimonas sp. Leaf443 TaxID=1736378 RepID=UPI0006F56CA5|nr:DUF1330 domain-containing protein [Aurantimonas sp. Leaf443]KQT84000.1 hypothetical protein ASG48_11510 [Aurantimonas sp. Leaf443]